MFQTGHPIKLSLPSNVLCTLRPMVLFTFHIILAASMWSELTIPVILAAVPQTSIWSELSTVGFSAWMGEGVLGLGRPGTTQL